MRRLDLFAYGTLQPRAGTRMGEWIAARTQVAETASVPGRICALRGGDGWFPALVPAHSGARVSGTLCRLVLAPGELAMLDRYEGREYRRVALPARLEGGGAQRVSASVYLWRIALPATALAVPGGDFLAWLGATGRSAFTTLRNGA